MIQLYLQRTLSQTLLGNFPVTGNFKPSVTIPQLFSITEAPQIHLQNIINNFRSDTWLNEIFASFEPPREYIPRFYAKSINDLTPLNHHPLVENQISVFGNNPYILKDKTSQENRKLLEKQETNLDNIWYNDTFIVTPNENNLGTIIIES